MRVVGEQVLPHGDPAARRPAPTAARKITVPGAGREPGGLGVEVGRRRAAPPAPRHVAGGTGTLRSTTRAVPLPVTSVRASNQRARVPTRSSVGARRGAGGPGADGLEAIGEACVARASAQDMPASSSSTTALPRVPTSIAGPTHAGQPSAHGHDVDRLATGADRARRSSVKRRSVRPTPPGTAS